MNTSGVWVSRSGSCGLWLWWFSCWEMPGINFSHQCRNNKEKWPRIRKGRIWGEHLMAVRSVWQRDSPSGSRPPTGHSQREAKAHLHLLLVPQESSLPGSLSEYLGGRCPHLNSGVGSGYCPGLGSAVPTLQMGMLSLSEWIIQVAPAGVFPYDCHICD